MGLDKLTDKIENDLAYRAHTAVQISILFKNYKHGIQLKITTITICSLQQDGELSK